LLLNCRRNGYSILSNYDEKDKGKDVFFEFAQINLLDEAIKEREKGAIVLGGKSYDFNESIKLQFPIASIFLDEQKKSKLWDYYKKDQR